jgi:hypothetical protein
MRHRFAPDQEVVEAVRQNRYELGLVTLPPDDARLAASPFTAESLELVVPAQETVHTWEDLARIGFIDHPDGQAMASRLLSRRFPANPGVGSLPCHGFCNHIGLILEPVARGLGFTVTALRAPGLCPRGRSQGGRLRRAGGRHAVADPSVGVAAVHPRDAGARPSPATSLALRDDGSPGAGLTSLR